MITAERLEAATLSEVETTMTAQEAAVFWM